MIYDQASTNSGDLARHRVPDVLWKGPVALCPSA